MTGSSAASALAPSAPGDVRGQIREVLSTRRAGITPGKAGLPVYGGDRRRVSGLRRDEAAVLAGISSEYYIRLERGNAANVTEASSTAARTPCGWMRPSGRTCSA